MKIISYSAPAKAILSGEHAVVYGKPALVSAIDMRLKFTVTNSMRPQQSGKVYNDIEFIAQKVKDYLRKQKVKFDDSTFDFDIDSEIPIGRGLGSSAALSTGAVAAFIKLYTGEEFDNEKINNLAYEIEKYFHKNPSGVDNTASCYGGLVYYRKEFEFLKNISSLNFKIPKKIEDGLYLIDSGKPKETTAYMVHNVVGQKYNKSPRLIEEVFNDIEKTTKRMVVSIIKEDINFFAKSVVDNQVLLEMLGVVSKIAKKLLRDLEPYGYGKVMGDGGKKEGSGFILFYSQRPKELKAYCNNKKISFYQFKQDSVGLRKE